jgi:hypothetical protein
MTFERRPVILRGDYDPAGISPGSVSFETVLDNTCERLLEKHIQYSIRRIREMDEELALIEMELDRITIQ